ncbi:NADH-quinone oxidoreductase subunit A [bacterium]|nr:NADH-quinone oxidoreductase subunit A [bacterium]
MAEQYLVVAVFAVIGVGMVLAPMVLGKLLRPENPYREKNMPYECGKDPFGPAQSMFDMRVYVLMLAFLIFDVEFVTIVPPLLVMKQVGLQGLIEIFAFVGVLLLGLVYLWRHGHLEWVKST